MILKIKAFDGNEISWQATDTAEDPISTIVIVGTNKGLLYTILWESGVSEEIRLGLTYEDGPTEFYDMRFLKLPPVRPEFTMFNLAHLQIVDKSITGYATLEKSQQVIKRWDFSGTTEYEAEETELSYRVH